MRDAAPQLISFAKSFTQPQRKRLKYLQTLLN
ncbi:hypothetical protein ACVXG9_06965 [Escherichia coli]